MLLRIAVTSIMIWTFVCSVLAVYYMLRFSADLRRYNKVKHGTYYKDWMILKQVRQDLYVDGMSALIMSVCSLFGSYMLITITEVIKM